MREAGIQNFLLYPATLKVILTQGEPKMLYSLEEARVFLRSPSSKKIHHCAHTKEK